jgi:hypothetical protein
VAEKVESINQRKAVIEQTAHLEREVMARQGHPAAKGPVNPKLEPSSAVIDLVHQAANRSLALGQDIQEYLKAVEDRAKGPNKDEIVRIAQEAQEFIAESLALNTPRMSIEIRDVSTSNGLRL